MISAAQHYFFIYCFSQNYFSCKCRHWI